MGRRVEAVDVVDKEAVAVFDVDPKQGLLREAVLGKLEIVEIPGGDRGHVMSVVAIAREGGADVEDVSVSPAVVLLRPDEGES